MTTPRNTEVETLLLDLLSPGAAVSLHLVEVHDHTGPVVMIKTAGAESMEPFPATAMFGIRANPGDVALAVRVGTQWFVVNTMADDDDVDVQYLTSDDLTTFVHEHPNAVQANSLRLGLGSISDLRGHAIGVTSQAGDADTAVGYGAVATGYISVALGWVARAVASGSVAIGYYAESSAELAIAIGRNAIGSGLRGVALGYLSTASGDYGTALGAGSTASAPGTTAIGYSTEATAEGATAVGYNSSASGIRSWAYGYNAGVTGADQGLLQANNVYFKRSAGAARVNLWLQGADNVYRSLTLTETDVLYTGNTVIGPFVPTLPKLFPPNKTVSSGAAVNLRTAPGNVHNAIAAVSSGGSVYDTGTRRSTDESWALVFFHGIGWGYFPATRLITPP